LYQSTVLFAVCVTLTSKYSNLWWKCDL